MNELTYEPLEEEIPMLAENEMDEPVLGSFLEDTESLRQGRLTEEYHTYGNY